MKFKNCSYGNADNCFKIRAMLTSFLLSLFSFCRCHLRDMWGDLAWHSRNVVLPSTPYWTVSRVFLLATKQHVEHRQGWGNSRKHTKYQNTYENCYNFWAILTLTVWVITSALAHWVAILHILTSAPSREEQQIKIKRQNSIYWTKYVIEYEGKHSHTTPCMARLHYWNPHLFCDEEYLEQDLPSQAQYGSLARQQSAQASPYTSQRWRARWVTPKTEPTYSCCYWENRDKDQWIK